jgi:phosphoribosylanthranilate isomerase
MLVKASSITNLTDARYFAAREVAYLGFNLEENSGDYLDPMYMKAIREWVQGPKIVGEFNQTPASFVREAAAFFGLEAVQVPLLDNLQDLTGLEVILYLTGTSDPDTLAPVLRRNNLLAACFLLDFSTPEQTEALLGPESRAWKELFAEYPVLLDVHLPVNELPALLQKLNPAGLALRGGDEERAGVKSFEEIDAIFEVLESVGGVS